MRLTNLDSARKLLKRVYCDEMGWLPNPINPISHRVEDGQLKDDYDDLCTWIGLFDDAKLIGVGRIYTSSKPNHEIDKYIQHRYPEVMDKLPEVYSEINRLAILKEYHKTTAFSRIAYAGAKFCSDMGYPIVIAPINPSVIEISKRILSNVGNITYSDRDESIAVYTGDSKKFMEFWCDKIRSLPQSNL